MPVYKAITTNIGLAKLSAADSGGPAVNITTAKLGDGAGVFVTPLATWATLTNTVWTGAINRVYKSLNDPTIFVLEAKVPIDAGPFWVREVGFFDAAGDMIFVANVPESYKPSLAEGAGRDQYYRTYFKHANATSVTVSVDPSVVMATQQYVDDQIALYIDQAVKTISSPAFVNLTLTGLLNGGTAWTSANDGTGSGLDADLVDGIHAASFARVDAASNFAVAPTILSNTIWHSGNDGAASGLDADLLDGMHASSFVTKSGASYIQSSGLSTTWAASNGVNTGAFNAIMGTAASATWLLSGTSSGVLRGGIQLLDNGGDLRIYSAGTTNNLSIASALTFNSNAVWHSGNDGAGSGLDADLLDGVQGSSFARKDAATNFTVAPTISNNGIWHAGNDGTGSGLDADLWDGNQFASYINQVLLTTSNVSFNQVTTTSGFICNGKRNTLYVPLAAPELITSSLQALAGWISLTSTTLSNNAAIMARIKCVLRAISGTTSTGDTAYGYIRLRKKGTTPTENGLDVVHAEAHCSVIGQETRDTAINFEDVAINATHEFEYKLNTGIINGSVSGEIYLMGYWVNC